MCLGDSDHKGGLGPGTDVCEHMLGVHTGARQVVEAKGPGAPRSWLKTK